MDVLWVLQALLDRKVQLDTPVTPAQPEAQEQQEQLGTPGTQEQPERPVQLGTPGTQEQPERLDTQDQLVTQVQKEIRAQEETRMAEPSLSYQIIKPSRSGIIFLLPDISQTHILLLKEIL